MAVLTVEDVDEGTRKETKYDDLPGVSKSSICIKSGFREGGDEIVLDLLLPLGHYQQLFS